jgi:hypothetical protein
VELLIFNKKTRGRFICPTLCKPPAIMTIRRNSSKLFRQDSFAKTNEPSPCLFVYFCGLTPVHLSDSMQAPSHHDNTEEFVKTLSSRRMNRPLVLLCEDKGTV